MDTCYLSENEDITTEGRSDNITDALQDSSSLSEIFAKPKAFYGKNPLLTGWKEFFYFFSDLFFYNTNLSGIKIRIKYYNLRITVIEENYFKIIVLIFLMYFFLFIFLIFFKICYFFLVSVPLEGEVEEEAPMSVRTVDSERSESSKG